MRKYIYSEQQTSFILENYPLYGTKYIVNALGITENSVESFVARYKLKIKRNIIKIDLNNKYLCYVLGLIWADGCISLSDYNRISIKMKEDDIIDIENILNKVAVWKKDTIVNTKNSTWKNNIRISTSDKKFKEFLIENDYLKKSYVSPYKILSKINEDNIKYFIRGYFDGDGCFFYKKYSKKSISRIASITSSYEQNWDYMIDFFKKIDCKIIIRKVINNKEKNHRSSVLQISPQFINKFGEYMYDDFFGLNRKYLKFKEIRNSYIYKNCIKN